MPNQLLIHFNISPALQKRAAKRGDTYYLEVFIDGIMTVRTSADQAISTTHGAHVLCCVLHRKSGDARTEAARAEVVSDPLLRHFSTEDSDAEFTVNVYGDGDTQLLEGNIPPDRPTPSRHKQRARRGLTS